MRRSIKDTSPWRGISFILTVALLFLASGCSESDQDKNVKFIESFGTKGNGDGQFLHIEDFAFDANGNLLVTDALRADVQVITKDGKFIGKFGGPGVFEKPEGVAVDKEGNIVDKKGNIKKAISMSVITFRAI